MRGGRFDLHIHTRASRDSQLTVEQVLRDALVQGMNGVAITDHNTMEALPEARKVFSSIRGFLFLPGVEVSTRQGHLLVYGVERPPPSDRTLAETLAMVREMNGVAVLAHPFRWAHGVGRRLAETAPVQGIEAMNGRNSAVPNAKAGVVATARKLAATGGSDAHEPGSVGRCYTEAEDEVQSAEDLLELLRRGRVHAEGTSQTLTGRVQLSFANAGKRILRGFGAP